MVNVKNSYTSQYFCGNRDTLAFKDKQKCKNTFIQQGCIKLIKSDNKDIYNAK